MRWLSGVLAVVLLAAFRVGAQPPPLEVFAAPPSTDDVAISPDGRRVVALTTSADGSRIGRIVEISDDAPMAVLADVDLSELKARSVDWATNEHALVWASEKVRVRYFRESDIEFNAVFSWSPGSRPTQLLVRSSDIALNSSLGNVVATIPGEENVYMAAFGESRSGSTLIGREYSLFDVKLKNGRGRIDARGRGDLTRRFWVDKAGQIRGRLDHSADGDWWQIYARDGNSWRRIYEVNDRPLLPFGILGLTPDGHYLVLSGYADEEDAEIHYMSLADGSVSGPVFSRAGADIRGPIRNSRSSEILGFSVSNIEGPEYIFFDPDIQTMLADVKSQMPGSVVHPISWSDDLRYWILRLEGGITAGAYLRYDRATGETRGVAQSYPDISPDQIAPINLIEYTARDGLTITALMTLPPGAEPTNLPTILLPHGGPESHDHYGWDWMAQYFASQGYAVLQPNFRGSSGFGDAFAHAGYGEWGRAMQDDLTDGVNAMVAGGYTDPDRVCIVGWSYGGYAALAGAVFTPELYRCAIAGAAISDLNDMLSDERRASGAGGVSVDYWREVLTGPDAETRLRDVSPVRFADNVTAPVLLIHGRDDTVVEIDQSRRMHRALRRAEKDVEFVELRGEDHWLSVGETRLEALRAMDGFLKTHLGPGVTAQ